MRVPRLPVVPQFRDRLVLPLRNEDRVVAEALGSRRLVRDPSLERAGPAQLTPVRREEHELGDVARAALLDALELAQQLRNRGCAFGRVARGEDSGPAVQSSDLEPRVLREHPARLVLAPERSLDRGVLVIGCARLGGIVVAVERLDRPAGQEPLQLACLVRIAGAEDGLHSIQRTSSTPSISATPATTAAGADPAASSTSTATERRSPSCATSRETRRPPCRSIASMIGTGLPPAGISTSSRWSAGRNRTRKR